MVSIFIRQVRSRILFIAIAAGLLILAGGLWLSGRVYTSSQPVSQKINHSVVESTPFGSQYTDKALFLSAIKQVKAAHLQAPVTGVIVPHHLLAIDLIAKTFAGIASNNYKNIVLLSPDHFNAGQSNISITERNFETVFGELQTDANLSRKLKQLPFVREGDFFYREHGLQASLPFIKYYFPEAHVTAMTFKPTVSRDELDQVISVVAKELPPDSLIVQSTDFSHYLAPVLANDFDKESIAAITSENPEVILKLKQPEHLDSVAALYLQPSLQKNLLHSKPIIRDHKNSQDYTEDTVTSSTSYLTVVYAVPDAETGNAELIFAGDVMLSRYIGDMMAKRNDYDFPFEKIQSFLKSADMVFGNLESPIGRAGKAVTGLYSFQAAPEAARGLKKAGFNLVSVANNHAFDYGLEGFWDTLKNLKNAGIAYAGGGYNSNEAYRGAELNIHGINVTVLAFTDLLPKKWAATEKQAGVSYLDKERMIASIRAAKKKSDLVIVSFHWGREYETASNQRQQELAAAAVEAGASLIVGHHPHVVQEIANIKNVTVAYSLGNFVFDQNFSKETSTGLLLKVSVKDKKIDSVTPYTLRFNKNFQPFLDEDKNSIKE